MALGPGDVIDGKYQIVRLLGEGGMGAVYEGLNVRIHRRVAIKVLHGNVAGNAEAVERFEREAQAAGRIGSSHIVEVLDLGDLPSGDRYMVMEFLEGQSLSERVRGRGKLPPQEIYPIAVQLLEGLAAAHAAGIVHRDLKPDNVYLVTSKHDGQKDFVKILDFGISKFNTLGGEFSMTRTGAVMGTPYYMSPEQAKGARELDLRADLYAVGVILYECSSGRVPFQAQTFNELLFKIVLEEPPPLRELQASLDEGFIAVVAKAMAREAGDRYQTASEFQKALHNWAHGVGLGNGGVTGHTLPLGGARPAPPPAGPPAAFPASSATGDPSSPTPGTAPGWSHTPADPEGTVPPARRRKSAVPWIALALAGLAVAGGGLTMLLSGGDESAAARAEEERRDQERAAVEARALEAEKRVKEAAEAAAKASGEAVTDGADAADAAKEPTPAPPPADSGPASRDDSPKPQTSPAAPTAEAPRASTPPPSTPTRPKSRTTVEKRPAATTSKAPAPAPQQPATKDKAKTSAGRTIRSTL